MDTERSEKGQSSLLDSPLFFSSALALLVTALSYLLTQNLLFALLIATAAFLICLIYRTLTDTSVSIDGSGIIIKSRRSTKKIVWDEIQSMSRIYFPNLLRIELKTKNGSIRFPFIYNYEQIEDIIIKHTSLELEDVSPASLSRRFALIRWKKPSTEYIYTSFFDKINDPWYPKGKSKLYKNIVIIWTMFVIFVAIILFALKFQIISIPGIVVE